MSVISSLRHASSLAAKRSLTGWTIYLWSAPFLIFGLVFTELTAIASWGDLLGVLLVGFVSQLGIGVALLLSRFTLLRRSKRDDAGIVRVLSVLFFAGMMRGLVLIVGFSVWQVGNPTPWWGRLTTSLLLISFSYLYAAYSLELWRRYVEKRRDLLLALSTNETSLSRQEIATSAYRDFVLSGVQEDIEAAKDHTLEVLDQISTRIQEGGISPDELEDLFGQSDRAWREVSHRAWSKSQPDIPRVTATELLVTLLGSKPVLLTALALTSLFGFLRVISPEVGLVSALPIFILWLLGQLGLGWFINTMSTKTSPWNYMFFGAGMVTIIGWPIAVVQAFSPESTLLLPTAWLAIVGAFFSLFFGLPIALAKSGDQVIAQLEKRVDHSTIRRISAQGEMFVLAQKVGAYLHGPLRSHFLQLSMELRSALEKADPFTVANSLSTLRQVVSGLDTNIDKLPDLAEFLRNWGQLVALETNIDDIHIPARVHDRVTTVVTEAVNNAIRHGKAKRLGVFFHYTAEGVQVEVVGSLSEGAKPGKTGLGAHLFDEIAPGMWSQDVTEDGRYRLQLTVTTA